MGKTELAAGDSTFIELIFNTGHYRGKVTKAASIRIETDTILTERVFIRANVQSDPDAGGPLSIEPDAVLLDDLRPDDLTGGLSIQVAMRNTSTEAVRARLICGPTGLFGIEVPEENLDPGEVNFITLAFDARIIGNEFFKSFTVELDDSAATRYTIPVSRSLPRGRRDSRVTVEGDDCTISEW